jgi:hypothetical protein
MVFFFRESFLKQCGTISTKKPWQKPMALIATPQAMGRTLSPTAHLLISGWLAYGQAQIAACHHQ